MAANEKRQLTWSQVCLHIRDDYCLSFLDRLKLKWMDGNLNTNGLLVLVADKQIFARGRSCWGSVRVLLVVKVSFVKFKYKMGKSSQQHIANLDDESTFDYFLQESHCGGPVRKAQDINASAGKRQGIHGDLARNSPYVENRWNKRFV